MKEIQLTRGMVALIDDEDFEFVSQYKWYAQKSQDGRKFYAKSSTLRRATGRMLNMHRLILGAPDGVLVDHKNGNGLDNRRSNLRLATDAQNGQNKRPRKNSTAPYKGITYHKGHQAWIAKIGSKGSIHHLGYFDSPIEAARAYDQKARELFGEFACLNFPDENIDPQGRRQIEAVSSYPGVTYVSTRRIWVARKTVNGRRRHVGSFRNELDAARALGFDV